MLNATVLPLSVPASKCTIDRQWPLNRYLVVLWPHSVSAYSSTTSPDAEVSVVAKSGPRPISM